MMDIKDTDEHFAGYTAYLDGASPDDNPYDPGPQHKAWKTGYYDAAWDD